jgi:AmmeMemoRadiSam system protein A
MTNSERRQLLALARAALEAQVCGGPRPEVPAHLNHPAAGLFVTIYCDGDLRGCLGTLDGHERLADALLRLAADVSHQDYRFAPLVASELSRVLIDVSVLTPAVPVSNPLSIAIGTDGLIVEQGSRKGLLLPQVAAEHGWDRETFLSQTCVKAGLSPDAWRRGAAISCFQAEVFREAELRE